MKLKDAAPWKESYDKPRYHIKKQRYHFADKGLCSQSYGFSISHVRVWELNHKEGWAPKNWCFQTVVLEKTLESPLDSKEIKPVSPKGNQPWIFKKDWCWSFNTLGTWCKEPSIGKDHDAQKNWGQEEKGTTEDEMVGWHHRLKSLRNSWRWWRTGKPGVLQSMQLQRVRQD